MGGDPLNFADISFFELDRLFTQSARTLRRKQLRKRRREREDKGGQESSSASRSPPRRQRQRMIAGFGGFTGSVDTVEKTIVVANVPASADEKAIFAHFSRCGTVGDVRIVRNRADMPTGTVIVEFGEDEGVTRACSLPPPHNEILGSVLQVKRADAQLAKSNPAPKRMMTRQQFTQQVLSGLKTGASAGEASGPNMRKLHIKNLRPVVTEEDMRGIFKPFGDFEAFQMGNQECWITFQNHNDAQDAMTSMQGFQLVGQELQIAMQAVVQPAPLVTMPPPPETMDFKTDSDFGATGTAGTPLHNRIELMKKLLSSHSQQGVPTVVGLAAPGGAAPAPPASSPAPSSAASVPPTPKPGTAVSRTLLLQNMFTPSAVNLRKDPRFYEEIREDTHEECAKFGKVLHVTVDPRGSTGLIYVLYETPQQRMAAELALNGRWFEGKKIVALGIDDSIWQALAAQAQASQPPPPPPA
uniref:RRM domain-containing protein n=1 Tax=Alexandrium catenella TaxID=2925 RepID=A0A7S1QBU1_ALECA